MSEKLKNDIKSKSIEIEELQKANEQLKKELENSKEKENQEKT